MTHVKPLLELHKKYKITTQCYGSLIPLIMHPTGGPLKPVLTQIAKSFGPDVDEAQVLMLWSIQSGVAVTTSSTVEDRIAKIAKVDTLRDLTREEMQAIDEVGSGVYYRFYKVSSLLYSSIDG